MFQPMKSLYNIISKDQLRVAVLISGQPRTLDMNATDPLFPSDLEPMTIDGNFPAYRPSGYAAVSRSIHENLFETLTAFDVFFYIEFPDSTPNEISSQRGARYCDLLRPQNPESKIVCEITDELHLDANENFSVWSNFQGPNRAGLLHQLFGLYRVNRMRKDFERQHKVEYQYLIRLRPDVGIFKPFPSLDTLNFGTSNAPRVLVASMACCCGNVDWFGVGRTEVMDIYFDRYLHFEATQFEWYEGILWSAESFLTNYIRKQRNASVKSQPDIFACVVKPRDRTAASHWGLHIQPVPPYPPPTPPPLPPRPVIDP
jgi:hypothetical protein